jgi:hypothetical protein
LIIACSIISGVNLIPSNRVFISSLSCMNSLTSSLVNIGADIIYFLGLKFVVFIALLVSVSALGAEDVVALALAGIAATLGMLWAAIVGETSEAARVGIAGAAVEEAAGAIGVPVSAVISLAAGG